MPDTVAFKQCLYHNNNTSSFICLSNIQVSSVYVGFIGLSTNFDYYSMQKSLSIMFILKLLAALISAAVLHADQQSVPR